MFWASLRPSSGGRTAFHCLWFLSCFSCCLSVRQHPLHSAHILPPDSPVSQRLQQDYNYRQWNAVGSPDDGLKDARNMLRYYWLRINHYLLHLVGFSFSYLSKIHGHSNIKFSSRFWFSGTRPFRFIDLLSAWIRNLKILLSHYLG